MCTCSTASRIWLGMSGKIALGYDTLCVRVYLKCTQFVCVFFLRSLNILARDSIALISKSQTIDTGTTLVQSFTHGNTVPENVEGSDFAAITHSVRSKHNCQSIERNGKWLGIHEMQLKWPQPLFSKLEDVCEMK